MAGVREDEYLKSPIDNTESMSIDDDDSQDHVGQDSASVMYMSRFESICTCDSEWCRKADLPEMLDSILFPKDEVEVAKQIKQIQRLISHGHHTFNDYCSELNLYRKQIHCGLAWSSGMIAFRCRTCSQSPSMSICAECFRNGDHKGHDYNMFKSGCGGACDCGFSIMKEDGHCSRHGKNAKAPKENEMIPERLLCVARRVFPRLIFRLVIAYGVDDGRWFREYLTHLRAMSWQSAILGGLLIDALISEKYYSSQYYYHLNHPKLRIFQLAQDSLKDLKKELKKRLPLDVPDTWLLHDIDAFKTFDRQPKNFLDELVVYLVASKFDEILSSFLLEFLIDKNYRKAFSSIFVRKYPCIAACLIETPSERRGLRADLYDQQARRIIQVSVQIYNDPILTNKLCDEEHALHIIIYCLTIVLQGSKRHNSTRCIRPNPLYGGDLMVVDCEHVIIRDRRLGSFTGDLNSILNFDGGTDRLVRNYDLLNIWIEMLANFQTMYPYKRELFEHAPYETSPLFSVFSVEAEFCLAPIWIILDRSRNDVLTYTTLLRCLHQNLAKWFQKANLHPLSQLDAYRMSFHIPLHRMFAATLRRAIYKSGQKSDFHAVIKDFQDTFNEHSTSSSLKTVNLSIDEFLRLLMLHPLQVLSFYHQIRCNMWTRNGPILANQALTYVHCAFSYSAVDLDMFILRYCASKIKPDSFIKLVMQRFYSWHCLSFLSGPAFSDQTTSAANGRNHSMRASENYYAHILPDQMAQMFESCLVLLIQLLTLRIHCDEKDNDMEQMRQELVALISVAGRTHSWLVDMLPDRGCYNFNKIDESFQTLLDDLTIYRPAQHGSKYSGNLQQGSYTLKPQVWLKEFDPMMVAYRTYQRRDYQQSLERFFQQAKLDGSHTMNSRYPSSSWPPFKLPKCQEKIGRFGPIDLKPLIECKSLLGVIFSVLHKAIHVEEISDTIMAHVIFILELILRRELVERRKSTKEKQLIDGIEMNELFTGKYFVRELFSTISLSGSKSKSDANLHGQTIYSLHCEHNQNDHWSASMGVKYYPVVKNVLNLAFESTWFPFKSAIDNCVVVVETIHSMPQDDFHAMLDKKEQKQYPIPREVKLERAGPRSNQRSQHDDKSPEAQQSPIAHGSASTLTVNELDRSLDEHRDRTRHEDFIESLIHMHDSVGNHEDDEIVVDLDRTPTDEDEYFDAPMEGLAINLGTEDLMVVDSDRDNDEQQERDNMRRSFTRQELRISGPSIREIDIQSRFMSFFQAGNAGHGNGSNTTSQPGDSASVPPSLHRTRQTARRSGSSIPTNTQSPQDSESARVSTTTEDANSLNDSRGNIIAMEESNNNNNNLETVSSITPASSDISGAPTSDTNTDLDDGLPSRLEATSAITTAVTVHPMDQRVARNQDQPREQTSNRLSLVSSSHERAATEENPTTSTALDFSRGTSRAVVTRAPGCVVLAGNTNVQAAAAAATAVSASSSITRAASTNRGRIQSSNSEEQGQLGGDANLELDRQSESACTLLNRLYSTGTNQRLFKYEQYLSANITRRSRKEHRQHYGESLLTLLLRLHAKYSRQPRSYQIDEDRLKRNIDSDTRSRLGDAVHFVTIVLDLICSQDVLIMKERIEHLTNLIWPSQNDSQCSSEMEKEHADGSKPVDVEERKRQAKERQSRLMAEFANKQRVFMEKHSGGISAASGLNSPAHNASSNPTRSPMKMRGDSGSVSMSDKGDENELPINLSSKSSSGSSMPTNEFSAVVGGSQDSEQSEGDKPETSKAGGSRDLSEMELNQSLGIRDKEPSPGTSGIAPRTSPKRHGRRQPEASENRSNLEGPPPKMMQRGPLYECCICGLDGTEDLTNPLGQVVLLQSTSIYGHSHIRPRSQRNLPCDETEYARLKEETYAKYLERRIDLLCEHFSQSSWLDSINIGAEGGVHVQSCGHYLHIECHQSYIRSLDQSLERTRSNRQEQDTFLCPVCRQLANSVLPMLNNAPPSASSCPSAERTLTHLPSTSAHNDLVSSVLAEAAAIDGPDAAAARSYSAVDSDLRDMPSCSTSLNGQGLELGAHESFVAQIIRLSEDLKKPLVPGNCKELHSSATFCTHLTGATWPQYRLVRSDANMHSLFLFLTSIARTNLECGTILEANSQEKQLEKELEVEQQQQQRHAGEDVEMKENQDGVDLFANEEDFTQRRSCFQLLFHVLALNARTLISGQWQPNVEKWFTGAQIWSHLTNHSDEQNRLSVKPSEKEVPLLLRDPLAILLHLAFAMSTNVLSKRRNFLCLVKVLFNLTVVQSIALVLSYMDRLPDLTNHQQEALSHQKHSKSVFSRANVSAEVEAELENENANSGEILGQHSSPGGLKKRPTAHEEHEQLLTGTSAGFGSRHRMANKQHQQTPQVCANEASGSGQELPRKAHKGERHDVLMDEAGADKIIFRSEQDADSMEKFELLLSIVWSNLCPLLKQGINEPLLNPRVRESWSRLLAARSQQDRSTSERCSDNLTWQTAPTNEGGPGRQEQHLTGAQLSEGASGSNDDHQKRQQSQSKSSLDHLEQVKFIENKVKLACLSFLRAAAFLQQHLYGFRMPKLQSMANEEVAVNNSQMIDSDFELLVGNLSLVAHENPKQNSSGRKSLGSKQGLGHVGGRKSLLQRSLNWPAIAGENGEILISSWSQELLKFAAEFSIAARSLLLCRPVYWYRPSLMRLPHLFDDIFMHYYSKNCTSCGAIPKDVAVCLVCGTPICFRVSCCKNRARNRQLHTQHCGANTAVFLAVHTSSIVVIRGQRACLWGSVYLDAHEEEDNGLQRGKPLYLVPARLKLLERQWLAHSFDHTCGRRWLYLSQEEA